MSNLLDLRIRAIRARLKALRALRGHPEYDPSQPRDEHGRWEGGDGEELLDKEPKQQVLKRGQDKKGNQLALVRGSTPVVQPDKTLKYRVSYGVYIRTGNYDGHVPGGIRYSWKVVQKDLDREQAEKLFNRRAAEKKAFEITACGSPSAEGGPQHLGGHG